MVVPPLAAAWGVRRPLAPSGGGVSASAELDGIRREAERRSAANPAAASVVGGGALDDAKALLESIRQEAQRMIDLLRTKSSAPASTPYTLPGLERILAGMHALPTPTTPQPAPKPEPKPEPKPAPEKPKPKPEKPKPKPAPEKPKPKPQPKAPGGTYTVRKGDSLSLIAGRTLGDSNRWREIYDLNRDIIANPNVIHPGQVLQLPGGHSAPPPAPSHGSPKGNPYDRRESWYISQYKSKYNTREDVPGYDNGNCGPTSVTMIAKAFGKINPSPAGADAAIEETRRRIGDGNNERSGTSVAGLARGAKSYGLDSKVIWGGNVSKIQAELAKGRLVIAHVCPDYLFPGSNGGHYTVVTRIANGRVYLNDPAHPSGPFSISVSQFNHSFARRGTYALVSVGP